MNKPDMFDIHKSKKYKALVEYVWRRRNLATRADIIRDLRLSNATVSSAINHLERAGVVEGTPMPTDNKGRRPNCLRICGRHCFAMGVSISPQKADISLVDAGQKIVGRETVTGLSLNGAEVVQKLLLAAKKMPAAHNLDAARLAGVGIVLPGFVDHRHGIVRQSSCFRPHEEVPVGALFEKAFSRPCLVLSTAPALALTEKEWGRAAGRSTFLYYTGTGLGMFLDGKLFMGHQSYGGEIGFMKFNDGTLPDADGRLGTFHHALPFRQIGLRLETAIRNGARTVAADWLKKGRGLSMDLIIEAALQGDILCRSLIEEGFHVAAEMIVSLNYLFNPEAVFLWPWTAQCPDISLEIVRRRLELCRLINPDMRVEVLAAQYGRADLARGIAMLPLNCFFQDGLIRPPSPRAGVGSPAAATVKQRKPPAVSVTGRGQT